MAQGMEPWRPDWFRVMANCAFNQDGSHVDANELVSVTRYTAELALSAVQKQCAEDYYHNYGAARSELTNVLKDLK